MVLFPVRDVPAIMITLYLRFHRRGPPKGGPSKRLDGIAVEPATLAAMRRSPAQHSLIRLTGRKFCGGPDLNRRLPAERDLKSRACTRLGHPRACADMDWRDD